MPHYSEQSKRRLTTCHILLQHLFGVAIESYDCSIVCGHRNKTDQLIAFHEGKSQVEWPHSAHNPSPSLAVDAVPYPVVWPDLKKALKSGKSVEVKRYSKELGRFYHFGGYVLGLAQVLKIPLKWGGDWDSDRDFFDQNFDDLLHFELLIRMEKR